MHFLESLEGKEQKIVAIDEQSYQRLKHTLSL